MIVADTNLLIYLYVEGERTALAEAVVARDPVWAAPLLWRSEFRNVMVRLLHRGSVAIDASLRVVSEAEHGMRGHEYSVGSAQVLQLAVASRCSAYDCEFVALAQDLGVPLITGDPALLAAFPGIAVDPVRFVRDPQH